MLVRHLRPVTVAAIDLDAAATVAADVVSLARGAAALTLLALMNAGYYDEAQAWRDWLLRAVAGGLPARVTARLAVVVEP